MRKLIILFLIIAGIVCAGILYTHIVPVEPKSALPDELTAISHQDLISMQTPRLTVSFSHEEFFYNETIHVSIYANNPDAAIYFTTDGSDPAENGELFTQPLEFTAEESVKCIVLKAVAADDTGQSQVLTHSYFIGSSVTERFASYVFSISADADNFFGYENGILIPGKIHDDYLSANPNTSLALGHRPANYMMRGREWERLVYVEVFTHSGERVIAQNAGIRVHGGATRRYPQKSLRLIARNEYERGAGAFIHNFFEDYSSACAFANPIISHNTLILRNDGNDFMLGRIRTPLISKIAGNAGFLGVSPQTGAAVFINGETYGFAWLNIQINDHFLQNLYSAPQRSFDIADGGNTGVDNDDRSIRRDFNNVLRYAAQRDMEDLGEILDIDNFLLYFAIQAYAANVDWPQNNIKIWRYTGDLSIHNLPEELDGRWRYILYDVDRSLFRDSTTAFNHPSINRLLDGRSPIFSAVMRYPEYAGTFANYICDMAAEHFSFDNVKNLMHELNNISLKELEISSKYRLIAGMSPEPDRNPYWEEKGFDYESLTESRERALIFAERRPDFILAELRRLFGYTSMYRIISDGSVKINTLNGSEGVYFIENSVPVFPVLKKGHIFDYWVVNGEKRYEEGLLISYRDANAADEVYIRLVTQ